MMFKTYSLCTRLVGKSYPGGRVTPCVFHEGKEAWTRYCGVRAPTDSGGARPSIDYTACEQIEHIVTDTGITWTRDKRGPRDSGKVWVMPLRSLTRAADIGGSGPLVVRRKRKHPSGRSTNYYIRTKCTECKAIAYVESSGYRRQRHECPCRSAEVRSLAKAMAYGRRSPSNILPHWRGTW